jgi:hypothetical protein
VNTEQLARYREWRRKGMRPVTAKRFAESLPFVSQHDVFNGLSVDTTHAGEIDGWMVHVKVGIDQDAKLGDDDVTGWFTDVYEPGCIRNTHRNWGSDYEWYHPSNYELRDLPTDGSTKGMSKQVAREHIAEQIRKAMADDADRYYVHVRVSVFRAGVELGSAGLYGIDLLGRDDTNYLGEVAEDLLSDAVVEAERTLAELLRDANTKGT